MHRACDHRVAAPGRELRAFAAIALSDEARRRYAGLQNRLRSQLTGVSWARAGDVHITLAFFGELEESQLKDVTAAMESAARSASAPTIRLQGMGSFPNDRRPRVLWCGLEDQGGRLAHLQACLTFALQERQVKFEGKPFSPHCTLGRIRRSLAPDILERWRESCVQPFTTEWWMPGELVLFESRGGYRPLASVAL